MLNCGVGVGGVGGHGGEEGEVGGGIGGGGNYGMRFLIKQTALLGETRVSSSSLSCKGETNGLFANSSLPLKIFPLCVIPNINVIA